MAPGSEQSFHAKANTCNCVVGGARDRYVPICESTDPRTFDASLGVATDRIRAATEIYYRFGFHLALHGLYLEAVDITAETNDRWQRLFESRRVWPLAPSEHRRFYRRSSERPAGFGRQIVQVLAPEKS